MTYRDRRLAKADRYREWADKREAKAEAARKRVDEIAGMIPFGQPILVGHHSEKKHRRDADRIHDGMVASIEHQRKADEFRRRADEIEKAAARAVYSDDSDAVEKLRQRIAEREEELRLKKAANAACKKGEEWTDLPDALLTEATSNFRHWPGGTDVPFPNLKNLSAAIRRDRKRLEGLS